MGTVTFTPASRRLVYSFIANVYSTYSVATLHYVVSSWFFDSLTNCANARLLQYFCDSKASDHISSVDESQTCVYVITVKTARLCHHPYLKPLEPNLPQPITCQPLLTSEEFSEYTKQLEDEQRQGLMLSLFVRPSHVASVWILNYCSFTLKGTLSAARDCTCTCN